MRHQPRRRVDGDRRDLLRRLVRDLLDLHAALGRGDDGDAAGLAVDQQREIEFLGDVDAVGDVEPLHLLAGRSGLDRHQGLAEHFGRMLANFVDRMGEADAALGALAELLEVALAAAAGMDLRLHDPQRPGQLALPPRPLHRRSSPHGPREPARHISRAVLWPDIRGCSWPRPLIRTSLRCKATTGLSARSSMSTWTPFMRRSNSAMIPSLGASRSRSAAAIAEWLLRRATRRGRSASGPLCRRSPPSGFART